LWRSVVVEYVLSPSEELLLAHACRVADLVAELDAAIDAEGVLLSGRPHPALAESRAQRIALARLLAALRAGEETGKRARPRRGRPRPTTYRLAPR
jgi:hypothetical protein